MMRQLLGAPDFHDQDHGPREPAYYYLRRRVLEAEQLEGFSRARSEECQRRARETLRRLEEEFRKSEAPSAAVVYLLEHGDHKPSQVTTVYWMVAVGSWSPETGRPGKWLIVTTHLRA